MSAALAPAEMSAREKAIRQRLKSDLEHYAAKCLKILPKVGGLAPLVLNPVQIIVHKRLEAQRAKTGKVRAIILKARQPGVSTYVAARYYHRTTHRYGCRAFILTHLQDATDNLFGIVERFHENVPALVKPATGTANAKELSFKNLDSEYQVGTAGTKSVGRSRTVQLLHGSEVSLWPNAEMHAAGVMQTVPDAADTEIILESTASGVGNYFHKQWLKAEQSQSDFEAVFIPWFLSPEYQRPVPENLRLSPEDVDYQGAHKLTLEQMAWRANKISELEYLWQFKQEYPSTPQEAFEASGEGSFINPLLVVKARHFKAEGATGPVILGVDPARGGGDKCGLIDREGRAMGRRICKRLDTDDLMVIVGEVVRFIDTHKPALVNIDVTGLGAGVFDRLKELGHVGTGKPCKAVNFAQGATQPQRYLNKRCEMYDDLRRWFEDPAGVQVPDEDTLQADLCAAKWGKGATRFDSSGRLCLESKDHIRETLGVSPDLGDASALTFAFPIAHTVNAAPVAAPLSARPHGWMGN